MIRIGSFFVRGLEHRPDIDELLPYAMTGAGIEVRAEPDNEFDPKAVALFINVDGVSRKLGYIPKGETYLIHAKKNHILWGEVQKVFSDTPLSNRLLVRVYGAEQKDVI